MESSMPASEPAEAALRLPRSEVLWLASLIIATVFTAIQIQSSSHSGVLSLPVTYDDVAYLTDGLARMELLYRDGFAAAFKNFFADPPHAPLQTFLAMAGFGLLGRQPWAAYAMNALPLALLLRLFFATAVRMLPLGLSIVLALAFLGIPILGMLVVELRPDMMCGFFAATGCFIMVADPRWRSGERTTNLVSAALFAGALLAKPTLSPVTVFVFGVSAIVVAVLYGNTRAEFKRIASLLVVYGGLGLLLAAPYYVVAFGRLYEYVAAAVIGTNSDVFTLKISRTAHALYYLTGPGGMTAIGRPWLILFAVVVVASAPFWLRARRCALGVFLVALAAYLSVTVPAMKSVFIGMVVPALLLVIVSCLTLISLSKLPRPTSWVIALVLLAVSTWNWRPVAMQMSGAVLAVQAKELKRITTEVAEAVAKVPDLGRKRLYIPVTSQYVNREGIDYEMTLRGLPLPVTPILYFETDLAAHAVELGKSDLAIMFSDDNTMPLEWTPSTRVRKEISSLVKANGSFESIAVIDGGPYQGTVTVLKRTHR